MNAQITFKELSRQTGLGEKSLHRMLNRNGNPPPAIWARLCEASPRTWTSNRAWKWPRTINGFGPQGQLMKIVCPNKSDPAWKKLVTEIGEAPAYIAFFRNGDSIPDVATARAILGLKAATAKSPRDSRLQRQFKPSKMVAPKTAPRFRSSGGFLLRSRRQPNLLATFDGK